MSRTSTQRVLILLLMEMPQRQTILTHEKYTHYVLILLLMEMPQRHQD